MEDYSLEIVCTHCVYCASIVSDQCLAIKSRTFIACFTNTPVLLTNIPPVIPP